MMHDPKNLKLSEFVICIKFEFYDMFEPCFDTTTVL